jgi:hypothetical protein
MRPNAVRLHPERAGALLAVRAEAWPFCRDRDPETRKVMWGPSVGLGVVRLLRGVRILSPEEEKLWGRITLLIRRSCSCGATSFQTCLGPAMLTACG